MALRESDLRVEMLVRSAPRVRMPRVLRTMVFGVSALLWLSGALWLLVHFAFPQHNEFGPLPHPWEPGLMRAHGILAVAAVFLLGWLAAEHIPAGWSRALRRASGLWLAGCTLVLVVSGYALYYSTGGLHEGAAAVHEWLGIAALVAALAHWLRSRAAR